MATQVLDSPMMDSTDYGGVDIDMGMQTGGSSSEWPYYESEMDQEPVQQEYDDNESVEIDMADYQEDLEEYEMADENQLHGTFGETVDVELHDENSHYGSESLPMPEAYETTHQLEIAAEAIPTINIPIPTEAEVHFTGAEETHNVTVLPEVSVYEQEHVEHTEETPGPAHVYIAVSDELQDTAALSEPVPDEQEQPEQTQIAPTIEANPIVSLDQVELAAPSAVIVEPLEDTEAKVLEVPASENDDFVDPPGPVLIFVSSSDQPDMALFNLPDDKQEGSSSGAAHTAQQVALLLHERSQWELYYRPLDEVFAALREEEYIAHLEGIDDGELVLEAFDLDMFFPEDNVHIKEVDLHSLHVMHSGSDPSKLLRLRIHVQPRFIHRYRYLHERIAALDVGEAEGGGDDSRLAEYNVEEEVSPADQAAQNEGEVQQEYTEDELQQHEDELRQHEDESPQHEEAAGDEQSHPTGDEHEGALQLQYEQPLESTKSQAAAEPAPTEAETAEELEREQTQATAAAAADEADQEQSVDQEDLVHQAEYLQQDEPEAVYEEDVEQPQLGDVPADDLSSPNEVDEVSEEAGLPHPAGDIDEAAEPEESNQNYGNGVEELQHPLNEDKDAHDELATETENDEYEHQNDVLDESSAEQPEPTEIDIANSQADHVTEQTETSQHTETTTEEYGGTDDNREEQESAEAWVDAEHDDVDEHEQSWAADGDDASSNGTTTTMSSTFPSPSKKRNIDELEDEDGDAAWSQIGDDDDLLESKRPRVG